MQPSTRQHIIAANGLVYGDNGILKNGANRGHDSAQLTKGLRFVRTAYVDSKSQMREGLRTAQIAWLNTTDRLLNDLASELRLGHTARLGTVPLDPVLQWREQLILDADVLNAQVANAETTKRFTELADRLLDPGPWEGL